MKKFYLITLLLCAIPLCTWADKVSSSEPVLDISTDVNHNFKAESYLGTWFEIARLPMHFERNCLAPITATYEVDHGGLKVINRCKLSNGEFTISEGRAVFAGESDVGKLKVSFVPSWLRWTHIGTGDYWVLYTDYKNFALVGSPDKKYLWVLARKENNTPIEIQKLIDIAKKGGYPVKDLIFNSQTFKLD